MDAAVFLVDALILVGDDKAVLEADLHQGLVKLGRHILTLVDDDEGGDVRGKVGRRRGDGRQDRLPVECVRLAADDWAGLAKGAFVHPLEPAYPGMGVDFMADQFAAGLQQ